MGVERVGTVEVAAGTAAGAVEALPLTAGRGPSVVAAGGGRRAVVVEGAAAGASAGTG